MKLEFGTRSATVTSRVYDLAIFPSLKKCLPRDTRSLRTYQGYTPSTLFPPPPEFIQTSSFFARSRIIFKTLRVLYFQIARVWKTMSQGVCVNHA